MITQLYIIKALTTQDPGNIYVTGLSLSNGWTTQNRNSYKYDNNLQDKFKLEKMNWHY